MAFNLGGRAGLDTHPSATFQSRAHHRYPWAGVYCCIGIAHRVLSHIKKEKYSTSYALAFGYVTNFIDPVVTQLIKTSKAEAPQLIIYIPKKLEELEPNHIDRIMAQIHEKKFSDQLLTIETGSGRTRDLISLLKEQGKPLFFDFPSTLLTLNSLIDYNLQQRNNSFTREELATQYISEFTKVLQELIDDKGLSRHVVFTDKSQNVLNQ